MESNFSLLPASSLPAQGRFRRFDPKAAGRGYATRRFKIEIVTTLPPGFFPGISVNFIGLDGENVVFPRMAVRAAT
jgi:hypothetical protein